jgi:serine/threonine protein kinase
VIGIFWTTQEPVSIRLEPELSDLINSLICINPKRRLSLDKALVHPYFKNNETLYLNKVAAIMRKMYPVESN